MGDGAGRPRPPGTGEPRCRPRALTRRAGAIPMGSEYLQNVDVSWCHEPQSSQVAGLALRGHALAARAIPPLWFMGSELLQNIDVGWGHEPGCPLTRPSGTLSPNGGEGWGEGGRLMKCEELQILT